VVAVVVTVVVWDVVWVVESQRKKPTLQIPVAGMENGKQNPSLLWHGPIVSPTQDSH